MPQAMSILPRLPGIRSNAVEAIESPHYFPLSVADTLVTLYGGMLN